MSSQRPLARLLVQITTTPCRNSLHPSTFGALQILKSGYQNGHLSAVDEAATAVPLEWVPENVVDK